MGFFRQYLSESLGCRNGNFKLKLQLFSAVLMNCGKLDKELKECGLKFKKQS